MLPVDNIIFVRGYPRKSIFQAKFVLPNEAAVMYGKCFVFEPIVIVIIMAGIEMASHLARCNWYLI